MKHLLNLFRLVALIAAMTVVSLSATPLSAADASIISQVTDLPADAIFLAEEEADDQKTGSNAESLFAIAMGERIEGFCLTCDFIVYFMNGATSFSQSLYDILAEAFPLLVPLMLAIWLGYRVAKMMTVGGEDGLSFIKEMAMKLSLFSVIFILVTGETDRWLWRMSGPEFLGYAFALSGDVRDTSIGYSSLVGVDSSEIGGTGRAVPYKCAEVRTNAGGSAPDGGSMDFVTGGLELTCVTERTHMVGLATGVAVIFSAFSLDDASGRGAIGGAIWLVFTGLMKVMAGTMLLLIFALSAVWMIMLLLDIVVEIMLIAAFSPAIAAVYLWRPTRGIAIKSIKMIFGSMVTAVALSIISVLAYFLLSNIVDVYNATYTSMRPYFSGVDLSPITETSRIERMREFIARTQETDIKNPQIPMNFSTPWFYYICMCGLAIFALGKKLMAMVSQVLGVGGQSELANQATKMTKTAASMSVAAGATALTLGGGAVAMAAPAMAGMATGGGKSALKGIAAAGRATKNIFGGGGSE